MSLSIDRCLRVVAISSSGILNGVGSAPSRRYRRLSCQPRRKLPKPPSRLRFPGGRPPRARTTGLVQRALRTSGGRLFSHGRRRRSKISRGRCRASKETLFPMYPRCTTRSCCGLPHYHGARAQLRSDGEWALEGTGGRGQATRYRRR